jgi:uncharacterized protein (TIGR02118 family)
MGKTKFFLAFLTIIAMTAFKSDQKNTSIEAGLFKVAVMYPGGEGKTFDMDYYEKSHMPMMAGFLGKNLKFYEIDKGLSGRTPKDAPPFVAACAFYCYNLDDYNQAISKNIDTILKDIKKYTNIQPVIFASEIRQVK